MEENNNDGSGYVKIKTLNEIINESPYKLSEERERELLGFEIKSTPELLYEKIRKFNDVILQAAIGTKNKFTLFLYKLGIYLGITSIDELNNKKINLLEKENSELQSRINTFLAEREITQKKLNELYSLKNDAALCFMDRQYRIEECILNLENMKKDREKINGNDEFARNGLVDIIAEMQNTENALLNAQRDLRRISTKVITCEEKITAYENLRTALDIYIDKDEDTLSKNEIALSKLKPTCNYFTKPVEVAESTIRSENIRADIDKASIDANEVLKEITETIADSKTTMPEEHKTTFKRDYKKKDSDIINVAKKIIFQDEKWRKR